MQRIYILSLRHSQKACSKSWKQNVDFISGFNAMSNFQMHLIDNSLGKHAIEKCVVAKMFIIKFIINLKIITYTRFFYE